MLVFTLDYFQEKQFFFFDKFFQEIPKTLIFDYSGQFLPKFWQKLIFLEKEALSLFKNFNFLTLHQKSEKTNKPFLRKILNCWTEKQTDNKGFYEPP